MRQGSRTVRITPLRYVLRSLRYRRGGFLRAVVSLTLLLTYLALLGSVVEGAEKEEARLLESGEEASRELIDFRESMEGWYTVTFTLYTLLMLFLALTYFSMVAVAREEEVRLLKNLGYSRGEVDVLFILEALILSFLTALISLSVALPLASMVPGIFHPFGLRFQGTFQSQNFLLLTLVLFVTACAGALLGGELSQRVRRVAV